MYMDPSLCLQIIPNWHVVFREIENKTEEKAHDVSLSDTADVIQIYTDLPNGVGKQLSNLLKAFGFLSIRSEINI